MDLKKINNEVYYSGKPFTCADASQIELLKEKAAVNERRRVRLCTHSGVDDRLHEMLIIHERDCYVRAHKHPGKSESIHVVQGKVDIVFFEDDGRIRQIIPMGDFSSGLTFYLRIGEPVYHTLLIRSDVLVFHETTNGPFDRNDTIFASWSPEDSNVEDIRKYQENLNQVINKIEI
jgi:cupin fold WbuC family metalloprotein